MTVINFNTKKQLQSGYSGDGIDSIALGVLNMPPKSIEFYPEEIIEIESDIIEAQLYNASNPIILEEIIDIQKEYQSTNFTKTILFKNIKEVCRVLLYALIIFFVSRQIVQNYVVDGISMEPTIFNNDYLVVNRWDYRTLNIDWMPFVDRTSLEIRNTLKVGDIVVFSQGREKTQRDLVKRIAGMPGQIIQIKNGLITVDDIPIQEFDTNQPSVRNMPALFLEKTIIPEGKVFVLGDNKYASNDSRWLGLIDTHLISGKVQLIYWPRDRWQSFEHQGRIDLGK